MLRGMVVALLFGLSVGVTVSQAQDCAAITKYGIFDVRKTTQQADLADDLLKWLSVNEFNSQEAATNAGMSAGIVIPEINLPLNSDNTYGEHHSSTWSKAAVDFLHTHHEAHLKFAEEFSTANKDIVNAWRDCVTRTVGLICWATPTNRRDEVKLSMEVRPVVIPVPPLRIAGIVYSPNLKPLGSYKNRRLNTKTIPLLFHRSVSDEDTAGTFVVSTNSEVYACSADVPALPRPQPVYIRISVPKTVQCVVAGDNLTNEGKKYGNKTLLGAYCHSPGDVEITGVKYLGCTRAGGDDNGCKWLDRHAELDNPNPPAYYPKKSPVNLRFASNGSRALYVTFEISYNEVVKKCIKNCPAP